MREVDISMNMLITGGAGFVGSHLCEKYATEENTVFCLDGASFNRVKHLCSKREKFFCVGANMLDKPLLTNTVGGNDLDAIIHLAAQVRIDTAKSLPAQTWETNVTGTLNLLEQARRFDIPKFLFASSSEVYGTALYLPIDENHPLGTLSVYGASKIAGDRLCRAYSETYGMNIGILRPFNIYGPGQKGAGVISLFVEKALKGQPLTIQGDGSQVRDYIFIDDVVSAYDTMLHMKTTEAVNFGTGVGSSVKDIAETVIRLTNSNIPPVFQGEAANTTKALIADRTRAEALGWVPRYTLSEGIQKYIEWFKEES